MSNLVHHLYHERQDGALCAQHCLNNLLQAPNFSPVDLAEIAASLDDLERVALSEHDPQNQSNDVSWSDRQFLQSGSRNMDDSGFFSIQVLSAALKVWNLALEPVGSESIRNTLDNPEKENAFILNFNEHWFTLRRFGRFWFDLNSTLPQPQFVSDTYLHVFLKQLQLEGYSVFVIKGDLPPCRSDQMIAGANDDDDDDANLRAAIAASLQDHVVATNTTVTAAATVATAPVNELTAEELRARRLKRFDSQS